MSIPNRDIIKLAFRIYRLDISNIENELNIDQIPQKIVERYNIEKEDTVFSLIDSEKYQFQLSPSKKIIFFRKNSANSVPHIWKKFFQEANINFGDINTELQHIAGFIIDSEKNQIFAISTGQAYVIFERYIDYDFPLSIARKIVKPEIKSGDIKGLTGYLQASSLQFRRPRRVSISESVGSIWTTLSGSLREEIKDETFIRMFGKKSETSVEIKASVYIKKKLSHFTQLSAYIDWLANICDNMDLPPDTGDDFSFLDAVRKISRRKFSTLSENLDKILIEKIENKEFDDFDLCHRQYGFFLNADHYRASIGRKFEIYNSLPSIDQIIHDLYDSNEFNLKDFVEKCCVWAEYDTDTYCNVTGSLKDLICGEIPKDEKTYFLFNNEWFELRPDFVEIINSDFQSIVSDNTSFATLTLPIWSQASEGQYNISFDNQSNFIVGDKVFSENTELFDLLHWESNKLSIIHIKSGFGVKTRDVTSQIANAAQIIENDIKTGSKLLKAHYQRLIDKGLHPLISQDDFIELFKKPREYVLAYGTKNDVLRNRTNIRSNIAKLELVQLENDMRRFENGAYLKLQWIEKTS